MKNFIYYPGCTLKNVAKDLDSAARISAKKLGINIQEVSEFQCCGGVYPLAKDEYATKFSSVRVLSEAQNNNMPLLTLCSACHHVIKRVNEDMKSDSEINQHVNSYLVNVSKELDKPYDGTSQVIHYLELLRDIVGFENLSKAVVNPFTGKRIGAYYGCLLLRPSKIMKFDNPENPTIIENFISAIGAEPVKYAYRNECCGGYITLENNDSAKNKVNRIFDDAEAHDIDCLVTACPLCMYNYTKHQNSNRIPMYYFSEMLAQALGINEKEWCND